MADKLAKVESKLEKFREAARQLEADDDEKRFDGRLGKIAKAPPKELTANGKKHAK